MQTTLIIIHVVVSVALILVVLMQHGKQQGLSGAIAGGAETFFGKNKGRTIDAMLKKVTAVVAVLFVVSSIALAVYSIQKNKAEALPDAGQIESAQGIDDGVQVQKDEEGNLVDANGNILMPAEQVAEAEKKAAEENAKVVDEAKANAEANE